MVKNALSDMRLMLIINTKIPPFSPKFVLQKEMLREDIIFSTCGVMLGKDGSPLVAIIGGYHEMGMEVWDPRTSKVDKLVLNIPIKDAETFGIMDGAMVTVKGGSEFIYYGGYGSGETQDSVWRYVVSENRWTR